jgi:ankyrin repeat protein
MNHIITLPTRGHIEDALENMMDGLGELDQLYSAAMARIGNKGRFARELAQKIFAWVLHVKRPLVTKELQHALAIQANTKDLDRTLIAKYFSDVGHLQSVCEGLVEVDSRNTVRLAHYTTYEYFDRLPLAWLTTSKAHVADMCLTYLSYDVFGRDFCFGDAGYETMLHDYPFYGYCSQYWGAQVRDADMDKDDFVFRLLINKEQLANCSHVMLSLDNPFADDEDGVPTDLPPMHVAAWFGLVGSLARLIQLGGEIDAKDTQARTPLMWAVAGSRISTVEWLLSNYGVDVNAADLSGATPLYTAIYHGDEDMVRILLRRGEVNMSHQDSFRATPLHIACMENQTTIAQMLLASGKVNVNARDCDGWTPLCMSVRNDDPATIKVLLKAEGIELNFRDGAGLVPLVIAASEGSISVVELLLQTEGIDVNFRDAHNMTPIFAAALQGHDLVVAVLLRVPGIELNTQDASNPLSPITAAMWRGHASVVKVFLNSGMIDVNAIDAFGYTPLMRAASLGHESVVRALLSIKDTVITRQNMHWQKAIALAAGSGHSSIARLLRESLPPEPPSNSAQETGHPAQQAFNADEKQSFVPSGESSILEWQNRGNSTSQHSRLAPEELDHELFITVSQGRIERLSALLIHNNGVSMNHRVNERRTPLLLQAVLSNQLPTAVYLLLRQADPNLKDSVGLTPLVAAAASGDVLMALTLIKYGAHPDIAHDEGPTPLVTAVIHEHAEMVWCLLKKGADPNHCMTPESSGLSPLVVAILLGNEKIARILLDHDCVDVSTRDEQNISTCALALAKGMDFVFRHIYDKLIARA